MVAELTPTVDHEGAIEEPYSILGRAGGDLKKQGELIDWHCAHIERIQAQYAPLLEATDRNIAELEEKLNKARETRADLQDRSEREQAWHRAHLLAFFVDAPQHKGMKARSIPLSRGMVIGARKQAAKLRLVDTDYLKTALPDCTETILKLHEGEAKKRLVVTPEGRIIFKDSGELLPEGIVEVERQEGDGYYIKLPDPVTGEPVSYTIRQLSDLPEDTEDAAEEDEDGVQASD
jgi:hypothetical protein